MSAKILTPDVMGIDTFCRDPAAALAGCHQGMLAVFDNNAPAFYAITADRLAALLALEEKLRHPVSDVALEPALYNDVNVPIVTPPLGKFAMYAEWKPDNDFVRMATLWGILLKDAATPEELASFTAYWQAEGKVFHHVQWQQKLARSIQMSRAANGGISHRDINTLSLPDSAIPDGFRG